VQKSILMDKYHIHSKTINKTDTSFTNVTQFLDYFNDKIEKDSIAKFIGIFNHYEHTKSLESGEIADDIIDAQNIVFCFGQKIPNPLILSIRPRSIAIVENNDSFVISFMEAPMLPMNDKMVKWVEDIS